MPYQWNQQSGEWEWTDTGPNYGLGRGATEPTLAHGIDPWQDVGLERLYGMAARAAFPSLESSDLHQRLVSRLQDPLMGQYQMSFPAAGRSEEGFQKWLMGEDGVEGGSRFYGQQGVPGVARPEWEQMINVARTYGQGRPEALESIGIDPRDAQAAYDRWYETGPLGVDESVRNILGLATFDPRAGSIYGRMRQAGLQRAQNRFFAENPFATNVDWLGHLTGQEALVNPDYYVGSTPTIPSEVAANGAPTGVGAVNGIAANVDDVPLPPGFVGHEAITPPTYQPPVDDVPLPPGWGTGGRANVPFIPPSTPPTYQPPVDDVPLPPGWGKLTPPSTPPTYQPPVDDVPLPPGWGTGYDPIPEPFIPNPTFNEPADWEYLDPSLEGTWY